VPSADEVTEKNPDARPAIKELPSVRSGGAASVAVGIVGATEQEAYSHPEFGMRQRKQGMKVCRYNWHSAGSLGWPFPTLKYKYIFRIKYTEAILSNSTRKVLWFKISKMLIAV